VSQTVGKGTHSAYELTFSREPSNHCGVTMSASVEGNIIADVMSKKPNVKITRFPAIIRIDGERMLEFDMEEIGAALGLEPGEFGVYDFEIETSTHYGGRCGSTIRCSSSLILKTQLNTSASTRL
jgi:propane monooxygenase coupling protein